MFSTNYDKDTITDFNARGKDHDIVDLGGLRSVTTFADLKADHLSTHGDDVGIDGGNGDVLVLKQVALGDLDKSDFII